MYNVWILNGYQQASSISHFQILLKLIGPTISILMLFKTLIQKKGRKLGGGTSLSVAHTHGQ
ncbi:hypothetical protein C5167_008950 [Papaver somniferum]|uniref:Uncharacterized protein n=1 Tax=Papaver somniferum TaxID=3469 RepID=A0A4Y7JW08_PAPSO|nr:hypothetical protein C5167_008950 [Papaver somniferum]